VIGLRIAADKAKRPPPGGFGHGVRAPDRRPEKSGLSRGQGHRAGEPDLVSRLHRTPRAGGGGEPAPAAPARASPRAIATGQSSTSGPSSLACLSATRQQGWTGPAAEGVGGSAAARLPRGAVIGPTELQISAAVLSGPPPGRRDCSGRGIGAQSGCWAGPRRPLQQTITAPFRAKFHPAFHALSRRGGRGIGRTGAPAPTLPILPPRFRSITPSIANPRSASWVVDQQPEHGQGHGTASTRQRRTSSAHLGGRSPGTG